jgi:hypothetical protein
MPNEMIRRDRQKKGAMQKKIEPLSWPRPGARGRLKVKRGFVLAIYYQVPASSSWVHGAVYVDAPQEK